MLTHVTGALAYNVGNASRTEKMRKASLLIYSVTALGLGTGATQAAPWVPCAQLSALNPVTCQIPGRAPTTWEYGIAYNTREPVPVLCTFWNQGARIGNKEPYFVFSDNPATGMLWGGFVFYQNTLAADDDVCAGGYRHRYWTLGANNAIATGSSNGCYTTQQVYCRRH